MGFEGAEKLLEISFLPSDNDAFPTSDLFLDNPLTPPYGSDEDDYQLIKCSEESAANKGISYDLFKGVGLRLVGRDLWQDMLNLVKCQILSVLSNEYADAYMLSESSLFVYPYKIILKTCGTTTLLLALPRLLELAFQVCKIQKIKSLFYSRKSFQYPQSQPWPHSSWQDEVDVLDNLFDNGAAYIMGNIISEHWYLYVVEERSFPETILRNALVKPCAYPYFSPHLPAPDYSPCMLPFHECLDRAVPWWTHDHTLEMLMTGLCPKQMQRFFYANPKQPQGKIDSTLNEWIPGLRTDSFQFDPCGWSQNGLLESVYTTIHVTPESECSYASFETNSPQQDPLLIQKILNVFQPTKVTITLFTQRQENGVPLTLPSMLMVPGYQLADLMINVLPNHYLFYAHLISDK